MHYSHILLEEENIPLKEKIKSILYSSYYFLKNLFSSISSFLSDSLSLSISFFKNVYTKIQNFIEGFSPNKNEKLLVGLCCGIFISLFSYRTLPEVILSLLLTTLVPAFTSLKGIIKRWSKIRKGKKIVYPISTLILLAGIVMGEIVFREEALKVHRKNDKFVQTFMLTKLLIIIMVFNLSSIFDKMLSSSITRNAYSLEELGKAKNEYLQKQVRCISKAIDLIDKNWKKNEILKSSIRIKFSHTPNLINFAIIPEKIDGKIYLYVMDDFRKGFAQKFLDEEIISIYLHEFGHYIFKKATSSFAKFIFKFVKFYYLINYIVFAFFHIFKKQIFNYFLASSALLGLVNIFLTSIKSIKEEMHVDIFSMLNYPTLHLRNALKKISDICRRGIEPSPSLNIKTLKTFSFFKMFTSHPEINTRLQYLKEVYKMLKKINH